MSAIIWASIRDVITHSISQHPRSLQRIIGPSQIGDPCDRAVLHRLALVREPPRTVAWKASVGTAVHAQLETWFTKENERIGHRRWITESRVEVGRLGDSMIGGTCDLWDDDTSTVIDFKCVGPRQITNYKANGPSDIYRTQVHLYGLGWANAGKTPSTVAINFLPRDGELSAGFVWSEPYDPAIATDALMRLHRLWGRLNEEGLEAACEGLPKCSSPYCDWCIPSWTRAPVIPGKGLFAA